MIWTATAANTPQPADTARLEIQSTTTSGVKWATVPQPTELALRAGRRLRVVLSRSAEEWDDPS